jgi:Lysyl oxidase
VPRHHRIHPSIIAIASLLLSLLASTPAAAAIGPQLWLVAAAPSVTIEHYPGERVSLDLGTNIVAGSHPFEIHVKRKSYHDPIVATQIVRRGQTRTLPAGVVRDFSGLSDFLHLTITNAAGKKVVDRAQVFCPNGWETMRTRPDAPPTSPYPQLCDTNPFTLGSVWGLQAGWAINTEMSGFATPVIVNLPDGTYTAKLHINQPYQQLFGIPSAQASATVKVTIRTRTDDGVGAASAALSADAGTGGASAAPRTTASSTRASSQQAAAPRPARRPTGRAHVPARFRPDLRPLPAWGIGVIGPEEAGVPATGPQQYLAFNANVWNAGPSPLVVDGFRRPGTLLMDAYQYFFDTSGRQVGWAPTGTLEYDQRDGHQHWHFTDFARYRLLKANKQEAVRSQKEAFCLGPTDAIDLTVRGANWRPSIFDLHTSCGTASTIAIRETLDTGWGDTYTQYLPGQSFDITRLPNGTYYIEVVANPNHRLYEGSTSNNVSLRKVILGGTLGNRTVTVPPYENIHVS